MSRESERETFGKEPLRKGNNLEENHLERGGSKYRWVRERDFLGKGDLWKGFIE